MTSQAHAGADAGTKRVAVAQAFTEPEVDVIENTGDDERRGRQDVTRVVLERRALPGDERELVMAEVRYPPGAAAPVHGHPVGGLVYIVEGTAESAYGDDEPRRYRAGETLQDHADRPHTVFRNVDPERPLRFLTVYVLEPNRPYVTVP